MTDRHTAAIEEAYLLIEAAQGHHDAVRVEAADREAIDHGWYDVRLLLHFARSLACLEAGLDDTEHVDAMLAAAVALGSPALLALALAVKADRRARTHRTSTDGDSASRLLAQAVVLLDQPSDEPAAHRAAALIEVGCVAHELGFWELALEYYERTRQLMAGDTSPTAVRQRRVVAVNRLDLSLDWAAGLAAVGDWPTRTEDVDDLTDAAWPPVWVVEFHGNRHLLAAVAGQPADPGVPVDERIATLGDAIRAARAGDAARAAHLAEQATEDFPYQLPTRVYLLQLALIAKRPGTNPTAIRYGDELARLHWNDRLDRMAAMRDAIAVERRRQEHERLSRDLVVDDLTGLANRRGYQAYLDTLGAAPGHGFYAVMMIDVDHFKKVNDRFGHDVGDLVLVRLGQILAAQVRPADLAARLGGDEFVVILAEVLPGVPEARAGQILDAVRTHPWSEIAPGLTVSVSIGVHHGGRAELPALLSDADRSLYEAKHHGRGRVEVAAG
ncbi:GGDEF domain-containing protein [Actinoplanes flavus]|uniref:GGDEF domain-containing protein n=1 Tax=Actinoplanes flavus TaxID=2820290 RepID=A0ABS3UWR6_9ACTN|nr:GGDEF domain-containing protein [Actinoplanes flavus]MBO3743028.1 GGDEF domain-containing protein [Actinoplanes flavus]